METDHQAVSEHYSTTKISDYMDCLVRSHRKEATPDTSNSTVKHGTPPKKPYFQQEMKNITGSSTLQLRWRHGMFPKQ
jgi:hypothetical protein